MRMCAKRGMPSSTTLSLALTKYGQTLPTCVSGAVCALALLMGRDVGRKNWHLAQRKQDVKQIHFYPRIVTTAKNLASNYNEQVN